MGRSVVSVSVCALVCCDCGCGFRCTLCCVTSAPEVRDHPHPHAHTQLVLFLSSRYFSVKEAFEEGLVDKLVPGFKLNRLRHMANQMFGEEEEMADSKPKFRFTRKDTAAV